MLSVQFPVTDFRIRRGEETDLIFDPIRRKWVVLTPEEWVRQNMIQWLVQVHRIPAAFIAVEKAIGIGEKLRRFDILVYNRQHQPWLLVECKSLDVHLSEKVLQQALSMFSVMPAKLVLITNGSFTYAWQAGSGVYSLLEAMPGFDSWQ